MLSVRDATATVLATVRPLAAERVALERASRRVLAVEVRARRPLPGFANSAMDGYAARASELPAELPVAAVAAAGVDGAPHVPPGACARIFTGAAVPPGLDVVVIQEDVEHRGDRVALPAARSGSNIRRVGEDIAVDAIAVGAGVRLGQGELGLLAALGEAELEVRRVPRVAIIATGDELIDVTATPRPGQVVNSSRYALTAAIEEAGGEAHFLGIVADDRAACRSAIERAFGYDVVLTTGGVSVGDHDFVKEALDDAGVPLDLWKVAMRPGKPLAFGRKQRGDGSATLVFGLPGNPVSSLVSFELFVRPVIFALAGIAAPSRPRAPVALVGGYRKPAGRAHFLRARVERDGARLVAHPHPKQGSGMMTSMIGINALVEISAETTELADGGEADALLLEAV